MDNPKQDPQTTDTTSPQEEMDAASVMLELEQRIKTFHSSVTMKRQEARDLKASLQDALNNDKSYMDYEDKIKDVKMQQQKVKDQIFSLSSIIQTKEEIKELTEEVKDLQTHLSKALIQYYEITKQSVITMTDGQTYEIKQSFSLIKQSSKYKP